MTAIRDARPGERDAILAVTLAAYEQYADTLKAGLGLLGITAPDRL